MDRDLSYNQTLRYRDGQAFLVRRHDIVNLDDTAWMPQAQAFQLCNPPSNGFRKKFWWGLKTIFDMHRDLILVHLKTWTLVNASARMV